MQNQSPSLNFVFTVQQAEVILNALVQLPYAQVSALVENIQSQAKEQLQTTQSEQE